MSDAYETSGFTDAEHDEKSAQESARERFEDLFKPMPTERQKLPPVLIENTLRKGAVMLVGAAPKVGKTHLAAQMIVAFATGGNLLGFDCAECETILVVNTEMGEAEFNNVIFDAELGSAKVVEAVHERVKVASTDDQPEMTVKEIAEIICASGVRPDVVVIDPIYPIFMGDENKNEDAKKTLGYLKMIASVTGAGVIYLHHFSKGAQDFKEARDRVSGAGTLGRNYAAMWSLTELAPAEDEMAEYPDGAKVVRFSTEMRSFKKSRDNHNLDFNAVCVDGMFLRDDDGRFDKTPTREAARRAEANKKTAQRQKKIEKVRAKVKKLLDGNDGEPVLFTTVENVTGVSSKTLGDYLLEMDEYMVVKMRVDGKGQARKHFAWTTWAPPLGTEVEGVE